MSLGHRYSRPSESSTRNPSPERSTEDTSEEHSIFTPVPWQAETSVSTTSEERCEAGKALSPLSTTPFMPKPSKNETSASGGSAWKADLTKFGLERMCPENSFQALTLVKLQRPLPLIIILRATRGIFSSTVTWAAAPERTNADAAAYAAIRPEAPPPMTRISALIYTEKGKA